MEWQFWSYRWNWWLLLIDKFLSCWETKREFQMVGKKVSTLFFIAIPTIPFLLFCLPCGVEHDSGLSPTPNVGPYKWGTYDYGKGCRRWNCVVLKPQIATFLHQIGHVTSLLTWEQQLIAKSTRTCHSPCPIVGSLGPSTKQFINTVGLICLTQKNAKE